MRLPSAEYKILSNALTQLRRLTKELGLDEPTATDTGRERLRSSLERAKAIVLTVAAQAATDFYAANREAMDAGAEIDWEAAISKGDLSALQTAMNFLCEDEDSFWSERQNEPRNLFDVEEDFATADAIAIKVSGYNKRAVPIDVEYVTAFIDVHQRVLFWGLCGFSPTFDGYILDYGVYPKQRRKHFVQSRARPTLLETYKGKGKEGAIYKGLEDLTGALFDLKLVREDGAEMPINRMLIDANWQTKTVNRFIRESPTGIRGRMTPSFGKGWIRIRWLASQLRQCSAVSAWARLAIAGTAPRWTGGTSGFMVSSVT